MVSTRPPTSKSSSPLNNPLVAVPKAPITIGIIVTIVFHSFFKSLARSMYLSFFSHSFSFILWSARTLLLLLLLLLFTPLEFFTSVLADGSLLLLLLFRVFHISVSWWFFTGVWVTASLHKSSRTLLSILAVLSNAVIWIVSTRPPTSKSSRPFNHSLVIVLKVPITISTIVTFIFHSFFNSLARSRYLSFFSHSFSFILWSAGTNSLLFLLIIIIISSSSSSSIIKVLFVVAKCHN